MNDMDGAPGKIEIRYQFPGAPFEVYSEKLGHAHQGIMGAIVQNECPHCGWTSENWSIGCFECFQMSAVEYMSHVVTEHWETLELLMRSSGLL